MHDIRDAWRALRATPLVSAAAVLSLALGIGATTAIFSILDAALLRPLPVRDPAQLVEVASGRYQLWEEIRRRNLFGGEFASAWSRLDTARGGPVDLVDGLFVSGRFFEVLGVNPFAGRLLTEADDRAGVPSEGRVAVISHRFWHTRFGGAPDAIGRSLILQRVPFTIVGVTPPRFVGVNIGLPFDVAVPLAQHPDVRARSAFGGYVTIMARLRPGQSTGAATAALQAAQPEIRAATMPGYTRAEDRDRYLPEPLAVKPAAAGSPALKGRYEKPLWVLLAVVAVVLLIACGNVAMLLVARTIARRHELGVRLAIGASRAQLARLMLTESTLLAAAGAAAGLVMAQWTTPILVGQLSTQAYTIFLDLSFHWRIFGFTAAVASLTTLLFGVAPAWKAVTAQPLDAMRRERGSAEHGRFGFGNVMLAGQLALAVALVAAAGLFLRTYSALAGKAVGFERDPVLVVGIDSSRTAFAKANRGTFGDQLREAVAAVPGVAAAGLSLAMPAGNMALTPEIQLADGRTLPRGMTGVYSNAVSAGWFDALGTRIVAGRDFDAGDAPAAPRVAIVNETFARRFLGGGSPIGTTLYERDDPEPRRSFEIVGVAQDAMYRLIREPAPPTIYFPIAQRQDDAPGWAPSLSVRAAAGSPAGLSKPIAEAIARVDPLISLSFRTLTDQVNSQFNQERMLAQLAGFFGMLALALAALGLYGLTSYIVVRRRMEIGVRLALGAAPWTIVRLVLTRIAGFVTIGAAAGVGLSVWLSRFVAALLYDVQPADPMTLGTAVAVLALVCGAAAWWPARRAGRLDPALLLRETQI